jgi:hypothetical protein
MVYMAIASTASSLSLSTFLLVANLFVHYFTVFQDGGIATLYLYEISGLLSIDLGDEGFHIPLPFFDIANHPAGATPFCPKSTTVTLVGP